MASKSPVLYRPALGRVGLWFELEMDWPPQPLHSRAPGKQPSAMVDTRWKGMAGQTVKCGSLQSWYQSGSLRYDFTVCLPSPPSLRMDMDPTRIDADRATVAAFYGSRPLLYDGTGRSVTVSAWLYDMEMIFYTCHIEDRSQVSLASRCLIADAKLWWMTYGEQQMPSRTWAHFRTVVLARYGPILMGGPGDDGQYRDPEIYRDMHYRRYQSFVDMPHPQLQALVILRNGVPPCIRRFVKEPTIERTVGDMMDDILQVEVTAHMAQADAFMNEHQVPVDDVGIGGPQHEVGPMFPEDPIPAMPVQEIPAQEAEDQMDAEGPADDLIAPVDPPEDPPVIIIPSDDEDEEDDMEPEAEQGDWVEDIDDTEGDPEEILFHDGDWDVDSDAESDVSMITLEVII
ncbi:hypothetical protein TIFTF001_034628 [Ficus carica]|uniref:Uncharacterized protein n=1 Tax=Ficus carica TaxID=3494 RepID=A0AA88J928_FICCA|nr:hypothetical protein TIFTF001_034628 [Ficus carica]